MSLTSQVCLVIAQGRGNQIRPASLRAQRADLLGNVVEARI